MYEYSYDPKEALLDKSIKFSMKDMLKIAETCNRLWDYDNSNMEEFFEKYDYAFWNICAEKHNIRLEIHADLFEEDALWITQCFEDTVDKAVTILLD